jgi:hypothetical protein
MRQTRVPNGYSRVPCTRLFLTCAALCLSAVTAYAGVDVTPTTNPNDLAAALNPTGLTILSVNTLNGAAEQYGTYTNFTTPPITLASGVVLSSGMVAFVSAPADPVLDFPQPSYDMAIPGTPEFDAYGPGHITNFSSSNDVAVLEVTFQLDQPSQIKFDFIFGSVEYPYWTNSYTDSFLVFLDGTDPANQITFDHSNNAVQVGQSFANLVTTADLNTAFADPHGLISNLTTTTAVLAAGEHTLLFEVGDVNDHILDSAVFIANLRTGSGHEGTDPSHEDGDVNLDGTVDGDDVQAFANVLFGVDNDPAHFAAADMNGDDAVDALDVPLFVAAVLAHQ